MVDARVVTAMASPTISVVMPLYNKERQVLAAIASVRSQDFADWELIVVDDGSTDAGPERVAGLNDPRIRLVRQRNQGVSAARNHGIEQARAELVAFLDADDQWRPGFLTAIRALQADFPAATWYATAYDVQRPGQKACRVRLNGLGTFQRGILEDYFGLATSSEPPVHASALAATRTALCAIGGFPPGISSGEDLLTWAGLALRYPLAYDTAPMAVFMVSGIERRPDSERKVGRALENLRAMFPDQAGLRAYLALWYRMQSVMAWRFNQLPLSRSLAFRSFRLDPAQVRTVYTFLLACLPHSRSRDLDRWLRRSPSKPL